MNIKAIEETAFEKSSKDHEYNTILKSNQENVKTRIKIILKKRILDF